MLQIVASITLDASPIIGKGTLRKPSNISPTNGIKAVENKNPTATPYSNIESNASFNNFFAYF